MRNSVKRIVILTMDCLYTTRILRVLAESLHGRIVLVCISDTYREERGSFLRQFAHYFKRSGIAFVAFLSILFVCFRPLAYVCCFGRRRKLATATDVSTTYAIPIVKIGNINHERVEQLLKRVEPDVIISFYFDQILKPSIFNIPERGTLNVHPGRLPDHRGVFPTFWAMKKGDRDLYFTVHYIDEGIDTGSVILCERAETGGFNTVLGKELAVLESGAQALERVIADIAKGEVKSQKQPQEGTYHSFPSREDVRAARRGKVKLFSISDLARCCRR